uniref:Uncharacterized protein n=1 Tax=Anguilla anguilla TaxID=7936 RepID=A0A0E9VCT4_ANGAN
MVPVLHYSRQVSPC